MTTNLGMSKWSDEELWKLNTELPEDALFFRVLPMATTFLSFPFAWWIIMAGDTEKEQTNYAIIKGVYFWKKF